MARAAVLGRLTWQIATVADVVPETSQAATIALDVPSWPGHAAGQHVDLRLTAEDGYQTQRSYSIASAPENDRVELTVERIDDGEVSPYLVGVLEPGDEIELRGPIGGHFTWRVADGGPLLLVAGGSGLVPLMAMLRHRAAQASDVETTLLVSSRTRGDLLYADELAHLGGAPGLAVHTTLTRERPDGWTGYHRRVDAGMLAEIGPPPTEAPRAFVCGPTPFVERAADLLVELGHDPARIHAERFGPTGG
jgi:ferredoxin-NADP reductase